MFGFNPHMTIVPSSGNMIDRSTVPLAIRFPSLDNQCMMDSQAAFPFPSLVADSSMLRFQVFQNAQIPVQNFVGQPIPVPVVSGAHPPSGIPIVVSMTSSSNNIVKLPIMNANPPALQKKIPMASVVYSSEHSGSADHTIVTHQPPVPVMVPLISVPLNLPSSVASSNVIGNNDVDLKKLKVATPPSVELDMNENFDDVKGSRRRQRSACLNELKYKCRYQMEGSGPFTRIRVWLNENGLQYYDCECGKRKPVQDLYKIKQHVVRHDVEEHVCSICSKSFKHHLQMNAHMKVHKKAKWNKDNEESESPVPNSTPESPSKVASPTSSSGSRHHYEKRVEE